MSENFMGQENRRNSSYQKKGKVDSPHSLLQRFVITWILDQALLSFVGGTGFWIVNQSICPARMRRPQITERKRACSDRGLVGSWRRWQFWEKYILFGIWGKWFQGRGKRIVIFHEANLKSFEMRKPAHLHLKFDHLNVFHRIDRIKGPLMGESIWCFRNTRSASSWCFMLQ